MGIYEAPREIVEGAFRLVEAPRNRERGFCCGAGGGRAWLGEEKGERVSETRARELTATGAEIVGTACPFCNTMFQDALVRIAFSGDKRPQLLDIAQIAAVRIGENATE